MAVILHTWGKDGKFLHINESSFLAIMTQNGVLHICRAEPCRLHMLEGGGDISLPCSHLDWPPFFAFLLFPPRPHDKRSAQLFFNETTWVSVSSLNTFECFLIKNPNFIFSPSGFLTFPNSGNLHFPFFFKNATRSFSY